MQFPAMNPGGALRQIWILDSEQEMCKCEVVHG